MAKPPVVWITRTLDGANRTARAVEDMGGRAVVAPVMTVRTVAAPIAADSFDVLILTSANAVDAFCDLCDRRDMPVYCVGDRTAQAAIDKGLSRAQSAHGDVSDLLRLIRAEVAPDQRLLYAAPNDPAAPLAQWLRDTGYDVTQASVYETEYVEEPLSDDDLRPVTHVLLHSPRAGRAAARFLIRRAAHVTFDTLTFVCISQAAWQAAHDELQTLDGGADGENSPARHVIARISAFPDEASMLNLLG